MRSRLSSDTAALIQANNNLEAARAEKELADTAVEEILTVYTSALPFAIVPNGNGVNPGSPAGNNPSGSPLGPVAVNQGGAVNTQQVTIGDLNSYLSTAYGAGVDPARPSTVTTLYPLSTLTINAITGGSGLNSFGCQPSGQVVTGSGVVQSVNPGYITINTGNGPMNLNIAGCSNLESTQQGQVLGAGNQIYYRGAAAPSNSVNVHSLTCTK